MPSGCNDTCNHLESQQPGMKICTEISSYMQACLSGTAQLVPLLRWGDCPFGRVAGGPTPSGVPCSCSLRCSLIGCCAFSSSILHSAFLALLLCLLWAGGSRLCFALLANTGQGSCLTGSFNGSGCSCLARHSQPSLADPASCANSCKQSAGSGNAAAEEWA